MLTGFTKKWIQFQILIGAKENLKGQRSWKKTHLSFFPRVLEILHLSLLKITRSTIIAHQKSQTSFLVYINQNNSWQFKWTLTSNMVLLKPSPAFYKPTNVRIGNCSFPKQSQYAYGMSENVVFLWFIVPWGRAIQALVMKQNYVPLSLILCLEIQTLLSLPTYSHLSLRYAASFIWKARDGGVLNCMHEEALWGKKKRRLLFNFRADWLHPPERQTDRLGEAWI